MLVYCRAIEEPDLILASVGFALYQVCAVHAQR